MSKRARFCSFLYVLTAFICHAQTYEQELARLEDKAFEYFYSNQDSTYHYFDKITQLALNNQEIPTAIDHLNYVCFSAGYFYDLEKIRSTIEQAEQLVRQYAQVLDTLEDGGDFQKNYLNYNKGNYYHKLQDYQKAESYFDAIANQLVLKEDALSDEDDIELLSQCYNFIAQMNVQQGRHRVANDYYQKNIRLYKEHLPDDLEGLHKIYNLYANSLYAQGNFDQAKDLWLDSFNFLEQNFSPRNRNSLVTTGLLVAEVLKDIGQIDSAYRYLEKTEKYKAENNPFEDRFLSAKGEILVKQKSYDQALDLFEGALQTTLKSNRPTVLQRIGDLHLTRNDASNALRTYQQALVELSSETRLNHYGENPRPNEVTQKSTLFTLLCAKVKALSSLSDSLPIKEIRNTVDSGLKTLDLLKPSFRNNADKLDLIDEAFTLFENGLHMAYESAQSSGGGDDIDLAFTYAEKSKSILLLEALFSAKATQFANIPDSLIQLELELKSEITHNERKLIENQRDEDVLQDRLFELREAHRRLVDSIETRYRGYYDLKYNTNTRSLTEAQRALAPEELLISYFFGNKAIYVIGLDKDGKYMHSVPLGNSLENEIKATYGMMVDPNSNVTDLGHASHRLFQLLLAPLLEGKSQKKLIIIPDGLLNYIPFGALNTAADGLSYLIEAYDISYVNSATLLEELSNRERMEGGILAFAPKFSGESTKVNPNRDTLLPLPHNKREVERILASFNGISYVDEAATLQNFSNNLSAYSTLHLATHAVFNDNAPEYSYLAFSSTSGQNDLLYVKDLYNLQLQSNLVTLSACETGVGELKKGEGFLSLARGFFYSGASSITSTLWKINDASTASIMDSFYQNLAKGEPKDTALKEAQVRFLRKNRENALAHPYYWSSFVISGNTAALGPTNTGQWIQWGSALFIALIGGLLFLWKKFLSQRLQ